MKKVNLLKNHPDIASQWDYSKNNYEIKSVISSANVWWNCPKEKDHCWQALVCNRIKGQGCPCCLNIKVVTSNCLATTHSKLSSQWHKSFNELTPFKVTAGTNKKVWWQCEVAEDHIWQCRVVDRVRYKTGCPFCNGKKGSSTNNLTRNFPNLAKEWDYEKNLIKPESCTFSSMKKVWWKCCKGHKWQATINNRTNKKQNCPCCSGKKADSTTSLLFKEPDLCKEWDYKKNILDPNKLLPSSHKKVHWICNIDSTHEWIASPLNRTVANSNCPYCNSSAGETLIKKYLEGKNIKFSRQYRFPDCKNKRALPFDFAIHCDNKIVLVEFQGKQHYESIKYYGGEKTLSYQQANDQIKRDYCKNNCIELIEIKYNQIKDIPKLLGRLK